MQGCTPRFNRHERPATTPDFIYLDHRPVIAIEASDLPASIHAYWNLTPDISIYTDAVHRLSDLGAVLTHTSRGISREDFDAEWRMIAIFMVEGDLISRCEMFDEADLDAALARFEELRQQAPRLENAASQVTERFLAHFAAGDWDAQAETLADDFSNDDRRRVVGAGVRVGRDATIADMRAIADLWVTTVTSTIMATRGGRLALMRVRFSDRDQGPEGFLTEGLAVVEINADGRIAAQVTFDADDFDAAIGELDARYLAGEAAPHARTWSVITAGYASISRHELPAMTHDCVSIDHRRAAAFAPGELTAYMRAGWELGQTVRPFIEDVHRLNDLGAVCTSATQGASRDGFDAEWREIALTTVGGDMVNRFELFDEADLDAALARFAELHAEAQRLENTASKVLERFLAHFAVCEWDVMSKMLADNSFTDDRRRLMGVGPRHDREVIIADWRAVADVGTKSVTATVLATRGERLAFCRLRFSGRDQRSDAFHADVLGIVEINAENRIAVSLMFDLDDIDVAFEELDASFGAGEAAAHAHTWSVIAGLYAGFNRQQLPGTTPDWIYIDHRSVINIEESELAAAIRAGWDLTPDIGIYMEAVQSVQRPRRGRHPYRAWHFT